MFFIFHQRIFRGENCRLQCLRRAFTDFFVDFQLLEQILPNCCSGIQINLPRQFGNFRGPGVPHRCPTERTSPRKSVSANTVNFHFSAARSPTAFPLHGTVFSFRFLRIFREISFNYNVMSHLRRHTWAGVSLSISSATWFCPLFADRLFDGIIL